MPLDATDVGDIKTTQIAALTTTQLGALTTTSVGLLLDTQIAMMANLGSSYLVSGAVADPVPTRAPIMAGGYRVLAADFHTHSSYWSDGVLTPMGLVLAAERQQLDAIAITGHNQVSDAKVGRWLSALVGGPTVLVGQEMLGADHHVIAVGTEQMHHVDRTRSFNALRGSTDIDEIGEVEPGSISANSILMDFYAGVAQSYLDRFGASVEDFARVAVKNRMHASLNPLAYLRAPQTLEDVLGARVIVPPLTLPMCSPVTDGSAAIVVCSLEKAKTLDASPILIRACKNASGASGHPVDEVAGQVYEFSGLGPQEFDLFELHDAAAPAELMQYHEIGLCPEGEGARLLRDGITQLGGRYPVNTSGGLLSRGHPLGATGCAQIYELVTQLRGKAEARQVEGARLGMAINGGGWLDGSYALAIATILERL